MINLLPINKKMLSFAFFSFPECPMISDTPGKNTEHIFNDLNARFKPPLNELQKVYKVLFFFIFYSF